MMPNNGKRGDRSSTRWQQGHFHLIIVLFFVLLQLVISSSEEVGDCPAGTYPGANGQCASRTGSSTAVGDDSNEQDSDVMVDGNEHEYDDGNFDDGDVNDDEKIDEYDDDDDFDDDDDDDDDFDDDEDDDEKDDEDDGENDNDDKENDDDEEDDEVEEEDDDCKDKHEDCAYWASANECDIASDYMFANCRRSCGDCIGSNPLTRYGKVQRCKSPACHEVIATMETYMRTEAEADTAFRRMLPNCKNRDVECASWAAQGSCDDNPDYMQVHCAPVCGTCMNLDFNYRCPLDPDAKNALEPGDLNRMFERIVDGVPLGDGEGGAEERWNATVHSRPSRPRDVDLDDVDYILGPWVITIDGFLNDTQCERLIQHGATLGYERSTDVGGLDFDGTHIEEQSETRTSYNAWCEDECITDPVTISVLMKIANLTGIPDENSEHLQLLKYADGQFYRQHHDYIEDDIDRPVGPRVLTAYLYLNDVEAGGGTRFPKLGRWKRNKYGRRRGKTGLTIMPKKGRLLLWPSVRDDKPSEKDFRTDHEALTVEKGEKYGANGWIHLRDFKTPHDNGCA